MNIITFRKNYADYKNRWTVIEEENKEFSNRNNIIIPRTTIKDSRNQYHFTRDFLKALYSFANEDDAPKDSEIIIQNYAGLMLGATIDEMKKEKTQDYLKFLEMKVINNLDGQDANLKSKGNYLSLIVSSNVKDLRIAIYQLYDSETMEQTAFAVKRNEVNTGIKKLDSFLRGVCTKPTLQSPVFYADIRNNGSENYFDDVVKADYLDNFEDFRNLGLKVHQTNNYRLDKNNFRLDEK